MRGENTSHLPIVLTPARKLRDATGLPLYYLDRIWHRPDRTTVTEAEFDRRLDELLQKDRWIIDGNYLRTLKPRLEACDTVFLLNFPLETCLAGARARIGKPREDMPWTEHEFDSEFKQWIVDFPRVQLPRIYQLLEQLKDGRKIIIFRSRREADNYLQSLSARQ